MKSRNTETKLLELLTQSPEFKHLLIHPIFSSLLWLKWKQVHHFYNLYVRFFMRFTLLFSWFVYNHFGHNPEFNVQTSFWVGVYFFHNVVVLISTTCEAFTGKSQLIQFTIKKMKEGP